MARNPRSIEQARANLESSIPQIASRYAAGVQGAEFVKYAASQQSEANYAAKVSEAVQKQSRMKGVQRAGDEAWRNGAMTKGQARIGDGVRQGLDKWATNFRRPYEAVVSKLASLPPRTTDPMANIDARLKPVVDTFVKNKVRGQG